MLYPRADRLLAASQAEKARIKQEEKRLKTLEPDTKKWTKEQRALLRPREWVAQSMTVYSRRDKRVPGGVRYSLQIPMEKWVEVPPKAEKQRQENPQMPVVTVDLGVNRLAVMGVLGTGDCEPRGS